jgi:antitoxin VapB
VTTRNPRGISCFPASQFAHHKVRPCPDLELPQRKSWSTAALGCGGVQARFWLPGVKARAQRQRSANRNSVHSVIYSSIYQGDHMRRTAKIFRNGRSQAVRLPAEFRFEGKEVFIRQDPETGDVVLSRRPDSWETFFELADKAPVPKDFMAERDDQPPQKRKLF